MASAASDIPSEYSTRSRRIEQPILVWVDGDASLKDLNTQDTLRYLRTIVNDVILTYQPDECLRVLEHASSKKSFVITSGSLGKELIPRIHNLPNLNAVYIFCANKQYHEQWSLMWRKVRAVETDIKLIGEELKSVLRHGKQTDIVISIIDVDNRSEADLNRLEPSFLHSSLLKNAILDMYHDLKEEVQIFKTNVIKKSKDKTIDEAVLTDFAHHYRSDAAIFWYTKKTFLYGLLNDALRNLKGDIIVDMGFFIYDIHHQLVQLHQKQLSKFGSKPFIVYRGQSLPKEKILQLRKNKGGLLGFNCFLSTSRNRLISLRFAEWSAEESGNTQVLFVMTIDPKLKLIPFADIEEYTAMKGEEEILFSMHTIFRIGNVEQPVDTPELYEVQLMLTSENDVNMKKLHDFMQGSNSETEWHRIGWILQDMNQLDKSEEIYQRLLVKESDEVNRGAWNHQIGVIKWKQGSYDLANQYYERALKIYTRFLPNNDARLASTYSALSLLYSKMNDYPKALSNSKQALNIYEELSDSVHELATCYGNIGLVYSKMGNYRQALLNYEQALSLRKVTLPEKHRDVGHSYYSLGRLHYRMEEYSIALQYLEKALGIWIAALPANDPNIDTCRRWIDKTKIEMKK